jgi:hypothetical protein
MRAIGEGQVVAGVIPSRIVDAVVARHAVTDAGVIRRHPCTVVREGHQEVAAFGDQVTQAVGTSGLKVSSKVDGSPVVFHP